MALTKSKAYTQNQTGTARVFPIAATEMIYRGALLVLNASGYVEPASVATGLVPVGVASEQVDNRLGANGDKSVETLRGIFPFRNSAGADEVLRTDIGSTVYLVDDETVAKTDGTGTRSAAGKVWDVTSEGVWVEVG